MAYASCLMMLLMSVANAQTLRDPTLPGQGFIAVMAKTDNQSLVLNSIVSGQHSYAVINNIILSVGDTVSGSGLRVSKINKDYVTLSDGRKLQLFQSITER
ncbi:MSHA biogenesis protein MshK [Shewanella livingstonensis]|nr:MSHA biogenesis protein MshK [Shewanella livingstonensis]